MSQENAQEAMYKIREKMDEVTKEQCRLEAEFAILQTEAWDLLSVYPCLRLRRPE